MPSSFCLHDAGNASTADHRRIETLTALQPSLISTAKPLGARKIAASRTAWPPNTAINDRERSTRNCENFTSTAWTGAVKSTAMPKRKQQAKITVKRIGRRRNVGFNSYVIARLDAVSLVCVQFCDPRP